LDPDQDGDGIPDTVDECPDTPSGPAVSGSGCSDQQSRDLVGSGTDDGVEDSKSDFFFWGGAVALILLLGSLVGVVNSYLGRNRTIADGEDGKEFTDIQGDWSTASLDMTSMPVLDGSSDDIQDSGMTVTLDGSTEAVETQEDVQDGMTVTSPAPVFDAGLFPGWTPEVIQTYLDQGWTLEQLKNWYDQHS
jgi:hypothetical protein